MMMPQNVPSSYCNVTGSDLLLVRLSAKFDVDLYVTFLNFQYNPKSNNFVNVITPQKLHVPHYSLQIFFSLPIFILIFMQPFKLSV